MLFSHNQSHGCAYGYFVCIGRHGKSNDYDLPYISAEEIEHHLEDYYDNVVIDERTMHSIYQALLAAAKKRNARALQRDAPISSRSESFRPLAHCPGNSGSD